MQTWILQANPERYPLNTMMRALTHEEWSAEKNIKNTNVDDTVYFWQSGDKAGIYGKGSIISNPAKMGDEYAIFVRYERIFQQPILKERLIENSILKELTIIKGPYGTCFSVSENQVVELENYTINIPYSKPLYNDAYLEQWKKKYKEYTKNRTAHGWVLLDQYLVKRQSEMLKNENIDVDSFLSNFWYNSGKGTVGDQSIETIEKQLVENPSYNFEKQVLNAINEDKVDISGSLIFETRTKDLAAQTDGQTRKSILEQIFKILKDNQLSYQDKIKQLTKIEHLDLAFARELVFIQSMGSIPIVNDKVKGALDIMELSSGEDHLRVTILENLSEYFGSLSFIELHRFLLEVNAGKIRVPKLYWHFCGKASQEELDKGSIFAPLSNYPFHKIITSINPGDFLISYRDQSIYAISHVIDNYGELRPDEASDLGLFVHSTEESGNYLKVNHLLLKNPVKRLEIDENQRIYSPVFDKNGRGVQGFLHLLPITFVEYLRESFEEVDTLIGKLLAEESIKEGQNKEGRYLTPLSEKMREISPDISDDEFNEIKLILEEKNQIILTGPPGTGKTYLAQEFAKRFSKYNTNWELIQFHPSYGYEDFIEGISVNTNENGKLVYSVQNKIFREICERALQFENEKFLLIIDEINRGDLSTIFGELIFGLEYRDKLFNTVYSEKKLKIPSNLFIIGTMNSSDHSIKLMDQALKRRFYFYPMYPSESKLSGWLENNLDDKTLIINILKLFTKVNEQIMSVKMDKDLKIGHSYFMNNNNEKMILSWKHAIYPLLESLFNYNTTRMESFEKLYTNYLGNR